MYMSLLDFLCVNSFPTSGILQNSHNEIMWVRDHWCTFYQIQWLRKKQNNTKLQHTHHCLSEKLPGVPFLHKVTLLLNFHLLMKATTPMKSHEGMVRDTMYGPGLWGTKTGRLRASEMAWLECAILGSSKQKSIYIHDKCTSRLHAMNSHRWL